MFEKISSIKGLLVPGVLPLVPRKSCIPSGVRSPAASASCQPFLRPEGASSPRRYASKRRRGSHPPQPRAPQQRAPRPPPPNPGPRPPRQLVQALRPPLGFAHVRHARSSSRAERPNRGCSTRANRGLVGTVVAAMAEVGPGVLGRDAVERGAERPL